MLKTAVKSLTLWVKFVSIFLIFVVRENGSQEQDADLFEDITERIFTGIPELPGYCSCLKHINKLKEEISGEL